MRASQVTALACLLLSGLSRSGAAEDKIIYVPYVYSLIGSEPERSTYWSSFYTAVNTGSETATLRHIASYGAGMLPADPAACVRGYTTTTLPPGALLRVNRCVEKGPDRGVGFLELQSTGPAQLAAWVYRIDVREGCGGGGPGGVTSTWVPQGRYAIPVYDRLFPAMGHVVSNDIDLGFPMLPPFCGSSSQTYLRRLNVTLFNPGAVAATFSVRTHTTRAGAVPPVFDQVVSVAPREVVQLNRLDVPLDKVIAPDGVRALVWVEVTADQPFLSYVSTVFDDGEPGSLPFEVQGMHLVP